MGETDPDTSDEQDGGSGGYVDLTLQRLQSMHAVTNKKKNHIDRYAKNGCSKRRVQKAVANPICKCSCSMPVALLLRVCIAFWLLGKRSQDTVLWTIQREHPGGDRKDWYIEGHCFFCPCF